ncbi:TetR/AcrR family transcriptional regulator [Flavobacterium pallidum]|uniref:TetR/AcrR family transcriptional regulator n=1 Tax=Flavobacterium pallidum TaxID=2172098 RepID=A0A2S1SH98_9FLAO|nr:TetR/AcrR family transcriptional regulator [Flavobacterium pallidum]AWI25784.1 TetR/AcrR family transcriptional regulator [Flavobacterium pallidum]
MRIRNTDKESIVKQKAIEMLVREGIEGFAMNRLAKQAGVSVATLYIYYTDKEDLIKKIGVGIGQDFFRAMLKDFSSDMHFIEGLRKQWENRAAFLMQNMKEVACWEVLQNSSYSDYIAQEGIRDFKNTMMEFFQNAVERKEMLPISKEVFWSIAYGPLYALLRFHNKGKSMGGAPFSLTQQIQDETFALVIKALTP